MTTMLPILQRPVRVALLGALVIATVGVAGCVSTHWEREATDEETTQADSAACTAFARRKADLIAMRPPYVSYFMAPWSDDTQLRSLPVSPWQSGRARAFGYSPELANNQAALQSKLFRACMEERGYREVSDDEAHTGAAATQEVTPEPVVPTSPQNVVPTSPQEVAPTSK